MKHKGTWRSLFIMFMISVGVGVLNTLLFLYVTNTLTGGAKADEMIGGAISVAGIPDAWLHELNHQKKLAS